MRFALNIDHIATVRNARGETQPEPVAAALIAEQAGVDGIVVHLREDRRHINDRDVRLLREVIQTKLDLEMAAVDEIIDIACKVKPELATIVPEKREELTTEGGIDALQLSDRLLGAINRLHDSGIQVSLFIEPDIQQIDKAKELKSDFIEIHTGTFANAPNEEKQAEELERIKKAAEYARSIGLRVNAGHGIDYNNAKLIKNIEDIEEVSIGHAVIARALFTGLDTAVRDMIRLLA